MPHAPQTVCPPHRNDHRQDDDSILEIDISVLFKAVMTRIPLVVGICSVCIALAVAYALLKTPIFKAPVRMLVEQGTLNITRIQDVYDSDVGRDAKGRDMFMTTQKEMIKSEHILARIFEYFNLDEREEYASLINPLVAVKENVVIEQVPNTSLLDISFLSSDPVFSSQVANKIAELYIDDSRQRSTGFSQRGLEKLQDELVLMEQRRNEAIENLNAYKKEHNILSVESAQKLGIARLTELDTARVTADEALAVAEASVAAVAAWRKQGRRLDSIPEALSNPTLTAFKVARLEAQMKRMQKQILREIDIAINNEVQNSLVSMQAKVLQAQTRVNIIANKQEEAHKALMALDMIADHYRLLEDKLAASEKAYRLVLERVNELYIAQSADSGAGGTFQVIVAATPPVEAAYPEKAKVIILVALASFMFSVLLCIVLELLDTRIQKKEDLEIITQLPVYGFVPRLEEGEHTLTAFEKPRGSLAEAFRALQTSLSLSEATRETRLLAITSSVPNEGKSFTALNIALAQAKAGKKVLLVDADMHKHSLSVLLPEEQRKNAAGLSNILAKAVSFTEIRSLIHHPLEGISLDVLPSGPTPPNPSELLGGAITTELCNFLLQQYDLVVFDATPILNVTDARTLAAIPDMCFLFIVRMMSTEKKEVRTAMEVLRTVHARVAGTVINNASVSSEAAYSYGYGYGYGYSDEEQQAKKKSFLQRLIKRA